MQFVREFAKLGLTRSVGGVLGLALSRELTPVVTSIILAGTLQSTCAPISLLQLILLRYLLRYICSYPTHLEVTFITQRLVSNCSEEVCARESGICWDERE